MKIRWGPPCKRRLSDIRINSSNVVNVKFHNKFWAEFVYQLVPWKVKESPKIIWQPKSAQDLLWNLTFTTLLELILMSLNLLLQGGPHLIFINWNWIKMHMIHKIHKYLLFYWNVFIYMTFLLYAQVFIWI